MAEEIERLNRALDDSDLLIDTYEETIEGLKTQEPCACKAKKGKAK